MKKTYIKPLSNQLTVVGDNLLDDEMIIVSDPEEAVKPGDEDEIEANEITTFSVWDE